MKPPDGFFVELPDAIAVAIAIAAAHLGSRLGEGRDVPCHYHSTTRASQWMRDWNMFSLITTTNYPHFPHLCASAHLSVVITAAYC